MQVDGANPLLEQAASIGQPAEPEERVEQPATAGPSEPNNGTYERFMLTFGSPARWAGH